MQKLYRIIAGSGIWINSTCKPDITFAVSKQPYGLYDTYGELGIIVKENKIIIGYADADFSSDELRHSIYS
jgi:hypothetical protein